MFTPAGPAAHAIAELGIVLIVAMCAVFVFVMALLALALRRRRKGPVDTRRWVIGGGVVFPVLVLSALLVFAIARTSPRMSRLHAAPPPDALMISVVGHLWWWEVRYRDPAGGATVVSANEIRVPVGRAVVLGLESADVIHSFWVPALAGKVDVVPGRVHQLPLRVDRPGVFRGVCAEFCGEQHARMALHVVALAPDDYERWWAAQRGPAREPADALAQRGRELFVAQRCVACHTVRGISKSAFGPDLTHVGSRLSLGAGTLPLQQSTLATWIAQTQSVKPGARMPSFHRLDAPSLQALAAYMESLR